MTQKKPAEVTALSFEDALAELKAIVDKLDAGQGKLDDAIAAYERGMVLKRHCEEKLREAEAKIEKIVVGPEGVKTAPFDPSA